MSLLVKICGLTRPEDAALACRLGATAIGLNFWPGSRRFVDDARARDVIAAVAPGVLKVAVLVNASLREVESRLALGIDMVQLHGDEQPAAWAQLPRAKLIRALRVRDAASLAGTEGWAARYFLYDAYSDGYGGSGQVAPWQALQTAPRPFLLAGGLHAGNIAAAVAAVHPDGVDVATGVEASPGIKDAAKLAAFIRNARAAAD